MKVEFEIVGLKEGLEIIAAGILDFTRFELEREIKIKAPKLTGFMAQGISSSREGMTAQINIPASYAGYVEYGHGFSEEFAEGTELKDWPALEKRGDTSGKQSIPFIRPAIYSIITRLSSLSADDVHLKKPVEG